MICPACRQEMVILEYKGIELDFCLECRGCWLDSGELGLIVSGVPEAPQDLPIPEKKGKRRCPRCGVRMHVGRPADAPIELDACPRGHGIWFDRGELVQLVKLRAAGGSAEALANFCREVFGEDRKS